jgi:hypothetical protein
MKILPINHHRQRRLSKVFFEENFDGEELVFRDLVYGNRMDYSFRLTILLEIKDLEGSFEVHSKINDRIKDYEKKFNLHSRLISLIFGFHGPHGIKGVEIVYTFSNNEFRNYENEISQDLEEFLQICSDSHLEDDTEISYSPVYKHSRSFYNPEIRIEFKDRNDIKELKKFSTLVIQILTSHKVFDKIEIKKIDVWDKLILIHFVILLETDPK